MGNEAIQQKIETSNRFEDLQDNLTEQNTPGLPNSVIMRVMELPDAEAEANALSRGVRSHTPSGLRKEMGDRLGSDFSGVRFHSDTASVQRSARLGARAWTQGRDVYFGKGGFSPAVAAHELVHTVQQGAVRGNVSTSMPMGAVQLLPGDEDDLSKDRINNINEEQQQNKGTSQEITKSLIDSFSTNEGIEIYEGFENELKKMINSQAGKQNVHITAAGAVKYLVRAANRDYIYRDILQEIIAKPAITRNQKKERIREYKALIKGLKSRIGPDQAEDLAVNSGIFIGVPKYEHKKGHVQKIGRAYQMETGENDTVSFNPNDIPQLGKVQAAIDNAETPEQAYRIFAAYAGNRSGTYSDKYKNLKVDMTLFRNKLKNMARVVTDYPEMRGMVGDMTTVDPKSKTGMSTLGTRGGSRKAQFEYNVFPDQEGPEGERYREWDDSKNHKDHFHIAPRDYYGAHEMGHVMASLLTDDTGQLEKDMELPVEHQMAFKSAGVETPRLNGGQGSTMINQANDEKFGLTENDMLMEVLAKNKFDIMKKNGMKKIQAYTREATDARGLSHLPNQIDTYHSDFYKKGMTSKYGSYSSQEFFAEAVADVYAHGTKSKDISQGLVKEYEKRMKKRERDKFNYNKLTGWQKFWRFFGF